MKLNEEYIQAMNEILEKSKVVVLPRTGSGGNRGMDAGSVGAMIAMYKGMLEGRGANTDFRPRPEDEAELLHKLRELEGRVPDSNKSSEDIPKRKQKLQFFDDKALYSE